MQRIIWIDIAKAICIIFVAIGHYFPDTHPVWYGEMRNIIYTFHMPLFMFVSGYVYIATKRNIEYGSFIWRKVKRLLIPYITTSILIVTIKICTQGQAYVENPVTLSSYLKIFYLPEAGYFLWFIWALWWMFVIIPLFKTPRARLCLLFVAFLLSLNSSYMPKAFCIEQFSNMLQFFVMGIVIYDWKSYFIWFSRVPILIVCMVFCAIEVIPYFTGERFFVLTAIIGIAFILRVSYAIGNSLIMTFWGKSIMTISSASYIIYLLHTTFEGFVKALLFKLPYFSDLSNDILFSIGAILVISIGVIIPVVLYQYILGRYQITRFLFGLK